MYAFVGRRRETDEKYKTSTNCKENGNKNTRFKPKWQPVNKSAKSQPSKRSENKQENNLPKDATKRVEGSQVAQESSSHSSILDHSLSSVSLPSPIKTTKTADKNLSVFDKEFSFNQSTSSANQSLSTDISSSHNTNWQTSQSSSHKYPTTDIETLNSYKLKTDSKSFANSSVTDSTTNSNLVLKDDQFEDLKNEMMQRYGFVSVEKPLASFNSQNSSNQSNSSKLTTPIPPSNLRKDNTNNSFNWSEIPPIIPPREPVRSSRSSQRHLSVSSISSTSQNSSTVSIFSPMPPCTSTPLIFPIMNNGKQESFTHYYLFADNRSKEEIRREQLKSKPLCSIPRPTPLNHPPTTTKSTLAPPRPPPPTSQSLISSLELNKDELASSSFASDTFPPCRNRDVSTDDTKNSSLPTHCKQQKFDSMGPTQKSMILQSKVFGVTNEDCRIALRKNSGDIDQAAKYLKIEQLYRLGVVSRDMCRKILNSSNWDLQTSSQLVLQHHKHSDDSKTFSKR